MTMIPEQSVMDKTKYQDKQIVTKIDCTKTSNSIYPMRMDQVLEQRVTIKEIKQE